MEYLGSSTKHADIILDMENRPCHVLTYNYDVSMFGGFLSLSINLNHVDFKYLINEIAIH